MNVMGLNLVVAMILVFYLMGVVAVVGILIAKILERRRERKKEREKFKDYQDY